MSVVKAHATSCLYRNVNRNLLYLFMGALFTNVSNTDVMFCYLWLLLRFQLNPMRHPHAVSSNVSPRLTSPECS